MAGFLDVLLRGLILAAQATAVGGVCFVLVALRASATRPGLDPPVLPRSLALIAAGAATASAAASRIAGASRRGESPSVGPRRLSPRAQTASATPASTRNALTWT